MCRTLLPKRLGLLSVTNVTEARSCRQETVAAHRPGALEQGGGGCLAQGLGI